MGFLDKVKNLFTEEVDEPIVKKEEHKKVEPKREIQSQERKIEIAPARRETTALLEEEREIEEVVLPKKEEKPLPIYFSDEDFADLEKPKVVEEKKEVKEFKSLYSGKKEEDKKEEKKSFKPSPIISPVYGILDKNYKKDDITTKETPVSTYKSDKVTVDDIRNKAYGVLEDDLESNLLGSPIIVENNEESNLDIFEELETRESRSSKKDLLREDLEVEKTDLSAELEKQKQQIEEINEIIKNTISPDKEKVTSRKIDNILEELDEIEELIPAKEENDIEEDFEEVEEINNEEIEEKYEDSYEEDYDDDYDDEDDYYEEDDEYEEDSDDSLEEEIEENMNTSEENENNKDELEESDLFNLIDSMYEKRDE